jgi:hypothetical protein
MEGKKIIKKRERNKLLSVRNIHVLYNAVGF